MNNQVAETILKQLGGRMFIAMTGANTFVTDGISLSFRIPNKRINCITIVLNDLDLYDVVYERLLKRKDGTFSLRTIAESNNLFFDQLQNDFTLHTGMYTRL